MSYHDSNTPEHGQRMAVVWGVFYGYPLSAIRAFIDAAAVRRGWLVLDEQEIPTSLGTAFAGCGFIPAKEQRDLSVEELEALINENRFASWPFTVKPKGQVPTPDQQEKEMQQLLKTSSVFEQAVVEALASIRIYSAADAPKDAYVLD